MPLIFEVIFDYKIDFEKKKEKKESINWSYCEDENFLNKAPIG